MVLALHCTSSLLDGFGRVSCASPLLMDDWKLIYVSYLILPGLYAKNYELKFSQAVLSVFVVALLTAGYSFTALLCFACRSDEFQAESVFLYVRPCTARSSLLT